MTFLDLCKRVRQECSIAGTGPASVTNQTGELKRIVNWVAEVYTEICKSQKNWRFLRSEFSLNTVADKEAYLPSECTDTVVGQAIGHASVGEFSAWIQDSFFIYLQSAGSGTQKNFWPTSYPHFRQTYQMQPPASGQPAFWTERPRDRALLLGPKPNAIYVITGEYYRRAPNLVADDDEPLFPAEYHMAIVWGAVMKYAGHEEDGGLYIHARNEYDRYHVPLVQDQSPHMELAPPLA